MALSAAAVCALVAATVSTTSILSRQRPERCCDTVATASRVTPTSPTTTATRPAGLPLCLVGSWQTVAETFIVKFYSDRPPIRFTGAGRRFEFRPDGTVVEKQDNVAITAQYEGDELRLVGNGTAMLTWSVADGKITYASRTKVDFTWSYYDERGLLEVERTSDEPALNEVDDYTCSGSTVQESNSGGYSSTWVRTSEYGVYG